MSDLNAFETVVREGTFLYEGKVECDVRVVCSAVRYGSGDHEDPPEIADDLTRDTYYIQYGSITPRGRFNSVSGPFSTLAEAVAGAEAAPGVGASIRWNDDNAVEAPGG
jgi:hypothetical protein